MQPVLNLRNVVAIAFEAGRHDCTVNTDIADVLEKIYRSAACFPVNLVYVQLS